jgi:two-component system, LuxR family, response regulator FixJ
VRYVNRNIGRYDYLWFRLGRTFSTSRSHLRSMDDICIGARKGGTMTSKDEIFIVDDDPAVRDALSIAFSRVGFHVSSFADGNSFLATARAGMPTSIILDVQMPGKSGLDILKELNAQNCGSPLFIISDHGDISIAVDAIKNGALDFIEKPFDAEAVAARVRDGIDAWAWRGVIAQTNGSLSADFSGRERLSPRELEVLALIASGASTKKAEQT